MTLQRTLDWYRERLGMFTASSIYELMVSGRKKDELFGETAKSYIDEVLGDRLLDQNMVADDFDFENYLDETSKTTKEMAWGTAYESLARDKYSEIQGVIVDEAPSIKHPEFPFLSCSPDGMVHDDGLIEIKCPQKRNFINYSRQILKGTPMIEISKQYYWQMQCQMAVTGRSWCDFVVYHHYISPVIVIRRVERNEEDIKNMLSRVKAAEEIIQNDIKLFINNDF